MVLTTASRAEQIDEAMPATTKLVVALMEQPQVVTLVTEVVPAAFPWVAFLPKEDVQAFVVDLVSTMKAAEPLGNPAPVVQVLAGWRHTDMPDGRRRREARFEDQRLAGRQCHQLGGALSGRHIGLRRSPGRPGRAHRRYRQPGDQAAVTARRSARSGWQP
ncbi:MAG TPA: hypothetical protein VGR06_30500 [Actinophytocola sp.]|uniref:hypothetical protein n=1 Tax=Actinophytocola sp. TaxID=1872138 RepID=UPI002E08CF0D|nr:hypothetical protein [Actinophytocola sp.]